MSPVLRWMANLRSTDGFRAFLAVFMVAVVGIATLGLPVALGGATTTVEATDSSPSTEFESYDSVTQVDSQSEPADDVYLGDNGSVVLQYEDDSEDLNEFDVGMDVSEGLVHMLVVDDVENPDEEVESANFSAILDQQGLSGSGSMVMQQPDDLEQLDVDVTGEVSEDANEFDAEMSGTFDSESTSATTVSTSGEIAATADRFETTGEMSAETDTTGSGSDMRVDASVTETKNGYTVDVTQEQTLSQLTASQWETREQAKQTLQSQYGMLAMNLGGSSEIEITNYDFQNQSSGQSQLNIAYTVTYTGIDSGIEEQLTEQLANSEAYDLSHSEATEVATSVTAVDLEHISFMTDVSEGTVDAEWDVAIANYDELTVAMVDLMEASEMNAGLPPDQLENARTAIEAQQAANLESTVSWDGSFEQTSSGEVSVDTTVTGNTENWDTYIDELESRDIESPNDVTFELTAETDSDKLSMDGEFELEAKELAGQTINRWAESITNRQSSPTMSSETEEFVSALEDSKLEVARIDAGVKEGTVRVEAGARFENMSAITDTVSDSMSISGIATEQTNETASMYVYVDEMDGIDTASATKSDLEHLSVVGPETTVHEAGEWDEEFPEADTDSMSEFLEQSNGESDSKTKDETNGSDDIPGFGIGAGLAALGALLTTLVFRRRP